MKTMTALRKSSPPLLHERPEKQNNRVITLDPGKSGQEKLFLRTENQHVTQRSRNKAIKIQNKNPDFKLNS